jgi:hypothetical protein
MALGATALAALTVGAPALASGATKGGTIHVYVSGLNNTPKAKVLLTGAIGDYGATTTVDKNGKPDNNGNYQRVVLKKGGFWLNTTALNVALSKVRPSTNASTCSLVFSGTGPATFFKGTGAYKGITGAVRVTVTFAGIASRYTSGAKKGQCNFNGEPQGAYQSITGVGKVAYR